MVPLLSIGTVSCAQQDCGTRKGAAMIGNASSSLGPPSRGSGQGRAIMATIVEAAPLAKRFLEQPERMLIDGE
jgi:hypothetical protein